MLSYSPYDQVEKRAYLSALLVTAGYNDSQVGYFEPAKWVAKLRRNKTDQNPLIFRTNMTAGHSGDSGRFGRVEEGCVHQRLPARPSGPQHRQQDGERGLSGGPRIVSLLPSATKIAVALGLGENLVGRSHECDFPAWTTKLGLAKTVY